MKHMNVVHFCQVECVSSRFKFVVRVVDIVGSDPSDSPGSVREASLLLQGLGNEFLGIISARYIGVCLSEFCHYEIGCWIV